MHLPWTQIENDAIENAEQVGRLLDLGPFAPQIGVGLVVKLHRWALRRAADGDFTGLLRDDAPAELVATALGFPTGQALGLWKTLARCGFVEGPGNGQHTEGSRVKGLERYRRAWLKNTRNLKAAAEAVPHPGASGAGSRRQPGATDADVDAEERISSPPSQAITRASAPATAAAGEDEKIRGAVDMFLAFATQTDRAFAEPGPVARRWAWEAFEKYGSTDLVLSDMRAAFGSFLLWCHTEKKIPGWGLWLREAVWLERFNTARADRMSRKRNT